MLEKSVKEHENNREGRLKDLEKKIKAIKAQMQSASNNLRVGFVIAEVYQIILQNILYKLIFYCTQSD